MMRTEHDIQDALNAKAAEAADQISLPIPRPRSLRRAAPVLGAIAAVAAVAVTVSLVATRDKSSTAQTTVPHPPRTGCGAAATVNTTLRFDFQVVDLPAGATDSPGRICSGMQQQTVSVVNGVVPISKYPKSKFPQGVVTVFRQGAFDPSAAKKGRRVTVQGHRGYFGNLPIIGAYVDPVARTTVPPSAASARASMPPTSMPELAWEYAPDSWAVVQASGVRSPLADAQLLADHVRIGEHRQLRMPFKLGWVPDSLVVGGAYDWDIGLSDRVPAKSADCATASCGSAMSIGVYLPGDPDAPHAPGTRRFKIDGHDAIIYPHASELDVGFGDRTLLIRVDPNHVGKFSDQDLINVAQHVTMSPNMTDQSTWYDATEVVPR